MGAKYPRFLRSGQVTDCVRAPGDARRLPQSGERLGLGVTYEVYVNTNASSESSARHRAVPAAGVTRCAQFRARGQRWHTSGTCVIRHCRCLEPQADLSKFQGGYRETARK
jgi:hypothetical protein